MYRKWKKSKFGQDTMLFSPDYFLVSADDFHWLKNRPRTVADTKRRSSNVIPRRSRTSCNIKDADVQTDPRGSISNNRVSSGKYRKHSVGRRTTTDDKKPAEEVNSRNSPLLDSQESNKNEAQNPLPPITPENTDNRRDSVRSIVTDNRRASRRSILSQSRKNSVRSLRSDSRKSSHVSLARESQNVSPVPRPPSGTPPSSAARFRRNQASQSTLVQTAELRLVSSSSEERHEVGILSCTISPDKSICITGSGDVKGSAGTLKAWDPRTGMALGASKPLCQRITGVNCSPRYPLLAWTEGEGCLVKYMEMGQIEGQGKYVGAVFQVELPGDPHNKQTFVPGCNNLNSSSDGLYLLATSSKRNSIFLIEMTTGHFEEVANVHQGAVLGGCFAPKGDKFITWCSAFTDPFNARGEPDAVSELKLFDMNTKQEICCSTVDGDASKVRSGWECKAGVSNVRFHPSLPLLACATHTGHVHLRDSATLELRQTVQAHRGSAPDLRFTKDGRYLITCSEDHWVKVWTIPDLKEVTGYDVGSEVTCVDTIMSDSGKVIINCGDNTGALTVLEMNEPEDISGTDDKKQLSRKAGRDEQVTRRKTSFASSNGQKASHSDSSVITGGRVVGSPIPPENSASRKASVIQKNSEWFLVLKNDIADYAVQQNTGILSCAVSLDQTICVTGSGGSNGEGGVLRTWDPLTGKPLGISESLGKRITSVGFSPRYSLLAWNQGDGRQITFWDLRQLESKDLDSAVLFQINLFNEDNGDLSALAWNTLTSSVDGSCLLATSTNSNNLYIVDMASGHFDEITKIHDGAILGARLSPDGTKIVTWCSAFTRPWKKFGKTDAKSEIKIFDKNSKTELCRVEADNDLCKPVTGKENKAGFASVQFHPKQSLIACTTHTGRLQLRDVNNLSVLDEKEAHQGSTLGLKFSRDGNYLVTCSVDRWVKVWSVPDLMQQAAYDIGAESCCLDTLVSPAGNLVINCGDSTGRLSVLELQEGIAEE